MRNWSGFQEGTDQAIVSLPDIIVIFSTPRHTAKMSKDYVSNYAEYGQMFVKNLKGVKDNMSFWTPKSG